MYIVKTGVNLAGPFIKGARNRLFATFHDRKGDDLGRTRMILVEWKPYDHSLTPEKVDKLRKGAGDFIMLLSKIFPGNSYHFGSLMTKREPEIKLV